MIEDYVLLYNTSPEDLVKEINTYLPKGYEPYGRPFIDETAGQIFQAMVKHKDLEDNFDY